MFKSLYLVSFKILNALVKIDVNIENSRRGYPWRWSCWLVVVEIFGPLDLIDFCGLELVSLVRSGSCSRPPAREMIQI